jgi:mevalonate kinase
MLLGEHAVLHYNEAIVCAITERITVKIYPQANPNTQIIIRSNEFTEFTIAIKDLMVKPPYEYVLAALLAFQSKLTTGFIVEINSTFSSKIGFGSSAAVTVAMVAVLAKSIGFTFTKEELFQKAKEVMLRVQGQGSGADLAASIYGGVLYFSREPFSVVTLPIIEKLTAVYSGSKLATKEVLAIVERKNKLYPNIYDSIFRGMTACVNQAVVAIQQTDWKMLGELFSIQQGLLSALGVSTSLLDELVWQAKKNGALGAKISGSGLGDCIIGLGEIPVDVFPTNEAQRITGVKQFPITFAKMGLLYG